MAGETRGNWLSTATGLFFSWALLSLCVRLWVKLGRKQKWTNSDSALGGAFLATLIHITCTFYAIHRGYGQRLVDIEKSQLGHVEGATFVAQISYVVAVGLTRISTAFFIGQLTRHRPHTRAALGLAATSALWTVATALVIALRGDLSHPWTTLEGTHSLFVRWVVVEVIGLILELALFGMSTVLVWGLQMKFAKRFQILSAFGARLLIIPVVGVRLFYLAPAQNSDPTFTSMLSGILTEAALEFALAATSIIALKPFLKPFHSGAIINTVGGAGSGLYPSSGNRGVYMLSSVSKKDHTGLSGKSLTERDMGTSRTSHDWPQHIANQSVAEAHHGGTISRGTPRESSGSEEMIIQTTKDWSVHYEERDGQ